ncbi:MAG: NAD-dependent epimerase/dehydratase family protein [Sphingobacteriaceae bacterium]|nr:NAD-dependent epimerase/dehydratase family protein [Sphingobacteriaceae bacterium]
MNPEKVFVTGANGMLGNHICRELLNQKYLVKAFCLKDNRQNLLKDLDLEFVYGNVLNFEELSREMEGCDYVIHIAAITDLWPRRKEIINKVNIDGTKNIVKACKKHNIKRLAHIGSASSFNSGLIDKPGDELEPFSGWKYGMDYLDSKYLAQQYLIEEYKENNFPVIVINPTFMIGAFDSGPSSGKMLLTLYKNQLPGYTNGGKNFVCTVDVASAAVNALKFGRLGECYIAGNENLTYKEFFQKACLLMNKPFKLKKIPYGLILSVGFLNSATARLIRRPPKLSYGIARLSNVSQYYNVSKARNELKMTQTPIENGIRQCLNWFQENNYCN